jgi:hypothetical protein
MGKIVCRVAAVIVLLVALAGAVVRGPMNHGWDWPWHDWWHSAGTSHHGWLRD